jgi:hypothetical protein
MCLYIAVFPHAVQSDLGISLASFTMGICGSFLGSKVALHGADHSSHPRLVPSSRSSASIHPVPHMPSWCTVQLVKHTDYFPFMRLLQHHISSSSSSLSSVARQSCVSTVHSFRIWWQTIFWVTLSNLCQPSPILKNGQFSVRDSSLVDRSAN